MKKILLLMFTLSLLGCASAPEFRPVTKAKAKIIIEDIVSNYAYSAKEMKVSYQEGQSRLNWEDQLHDENNLMSWVQREWVITGSDEVSSLFKEKNGVALTLSGGGKEATFYCEDERRARHLANALRNLIRKAAP